MSIEQKTNPNPDSNISKTGYRALFVLMKLLEAPYTRDELVEICKNDPIINKEFSTDTITYTINTLKEAGCIISHPNQKYGHKYFVKYHPFNPLLKKEHVSALQELRESIATLGDWALVIYLNNLYIKLARIAEEEEAKQLLIYNHPLKGIDYKILNELMVCAQRTTEHINITYDSPENGLEELEIAPEYLTYENDKLYVWGHCKKYDQTSYLRVDRIKRVNTVTFTFRSDKEKIYARPLLKAKYKLKGYSALMYSDNEHECILEHNEKSEYPLTILAEVKNEFNFYQRLLSYGTDCLIVSPDSVKQEFLARLKKVKSRYIDD